jgi:cysteine-rich repeat protein
MHNSALVRSLSFGLCAITLAACGDDGGDGSGASAGQTQTTNSSVGPTTLPGSISDSDGTTADPTDGGTMGGSATTGSTTMTSDGTTSAEPVCGNGSIEPGEMCDDGNQDAADGCEPDCTPTPVCGNGVPEAGEACDDGNNIDGDECSGDCQMATPPQECGNGSVENPEACDDGNQVAGDGCEPDCTLTPAECGNGNVEQGEQCDDGNDVDGGANDFCKNDCTNFVPPQCASPADYVVCDSDLNLGTKNDPNYMLRSIGICNAQANNSVITTDLQWSNPSAQSWQVAKGFGNYTYDHDMDANTPPKLLYSPREGDTFLMLSSGTITAPNGQGVVTFAPNSQTHLDNGNPDGAGLPPPFKVENGSNNGAGGTPFQNCDNGNGDRDCSDTLYDQWQMTGGDANDRIYFTFKTTVPDGTFGYTFDFVFCSAEWPVYVNSSFNDLLISYQVDPTPDDPNANPPVDPYSGNVTFIPDPNNPMQGLPLTITALDPYFDGPGYTVNEPQLQGTGFEQHACSDWFTAKGGVQPGANITVGFFLADMSDDYLTTLAILDNFRWDCEGCVPSEIDDCGVQPQ